jgi:hypothetical protein
MASELDDKVHVCGCGGIFPLASSSPDAADGLFSHDCPNDRKIPGRISDGVNVDRPDNWTGGARNARPTVEPASEQAINLLTALARGIIAARPGGGTEADVEQKVAAIGTTRSRVSEAIDKAKAAGVKPIWDALTGQRTADAPVRVETCDPTSTPTSASPAAGLYPPASGTSTAPQGFGRHGTCPANVQPTRHPHRRTAR